MQHATDSEEKKRKKKTAVTHFSREKDNIRLGRQLKKLARRASFLALLHFRADIKTQLRKRDFFCPGLFLLMSPRFFLALSVLNCRPFIPRSFYCSV